jgi:hypothetical protein
MERSLDFHKDLMIRQHLKEMRASDPKLTFTQAWTRLQKQRPELFQSEPGSGPEKDEPGETRQPAIKLGAQPAKSSLERVQSGDYISARSEDIRQLERIEASLR